MPLDFIKHYLRKQNKEEKNHSTTRRESTFNMDETSR
jgi:hypothetical protein